VEEARVVICLNSTSHISFVLIFRGVIRAHCQHHQPSDPRATWEFQFTNRSNLNGKSATITTFG